MTQWTNLATPLQPADLTAEEKFCGTLILNTDLLSETMLDIHPEMLYGIKYRYIYEAMCQLFLSGDPITPDTIASNLKYKKDLEGSKLEVVGGTSAILETMIDINPDEFEFWNTVLKAKHRERLLLKFSKDAQDIALSSPKDLKAAMAGLEEKLISIVDEKQYNSISISNAMPELDLRIERYITNPDDIIGIKSGYARLDKDIDGFQAGNVTIIYAPTSRFKSLFTQNLGWRFAQQGIPGLWFTTEMPRVQVLERLLQLEAGLNLKWLRRDKRVFQNKKSINDGMNKIKSYPIYFCDTSSLDVAEVRSEISRHRRWNNIEYVIIDLVDHVSSSKFKDEMVNNQRAVMAAMKHIAKDFNVHIILVSHVAKGNEQTRRNADLDVEEMTGSAAKGQDVDVSISIAPAKYDDRMNIVAMQRDDILWRVADTGKLDVLISITKNRHGELDRFLLDLDFNMGGRFLENGWIEVKRPIPKEPAEIEE